MDKALQTMINNMPEKTGKSLDQWREILQAKAFEKHGEAVQYLKSEHSVTHGFANTIVALFKNEGHTEEDLTTLQYKGKESLVPIYDKLISVISALGPDVQTSPKKTSVSMIRKRQFALIKPATKKRIDLGLKLKGIEPHGRLGDSGPFGAMCTHRIQLTSVDEVDEEVVGWLQKAYDLSV